MSCCWNIMFSGLKNYHLPQGFSDGLILGVAGPFLKHSRPYEIPLRVFSRFNEIGTISALEEVRWVHAHIGGK
jgi:hypothetical protein